MCITIKQALSTVLFNGSQIEVLQVVSQLFIFVENNLSDCI